MKASFNNREAFLAALIGNELQLTGTGLPDEGVSWELKVTYMGAA